MGVREQPEQILCPFEVIVFNNIHSVLRSRPDVVQTWDDTEVARRWWTLCPKRKVQREVDGQNLCPYVTFASCLRARNRNVQPSSGRFRRDRKILSQRHRDTKEDWSIWQYKPAVVEPILFSDSLLIELRAFVPSCETLMLKGTNGGDKRNQAHSQLISYMHRKIAHKGTKTQRKIGRFGDIKLPLLNRFSFQLQCQLNFVPWCLRARHCCSGGRMGEAKGRKRDTACVRVSSCNLNSCVGLSTKGVDDRNPLPRTNPVSLIGQKL
jgi:hypothetical protein